jgi:hypothetical protein
VQVRDSLGCAKRAMDLVRHALLPASDASPLWQQPFHAASLLLPEALDALFLILDRLSTAPRSGSFGAGTQTMINATLVRALACGRVCGL